MRALGGTRRLIAGLAGGGVRPAGAVRRARWRWWGPRSTVAVLQRQVFGLGISVHPWLWLLGPLVGTGADSGGGPARHPQPRCPPRPCWCCAASTDSRADRHACWLPVLAPRLGLGRRPHQAESQRTEHEHVAHGCSGPDVAAIPTAPPPSGRARHVRVLRRGSIRVAPSAVLWLPLFMALALWVVSGPPAGRRPPLIPWRCARTCSPAGLSCARPVRADGARRGVAWLTAWWWARRRERPAWSLHGLEQRLFEHSPGARWWSPTADDRILAVNEAYTRMTGYSQAEVAGRDIAFNHAGQQDESFYAAMRESLATARPLGRRVLAAQQGRARRLPTR